MSAPYDVKRRNILLIMTDEQCADAMSCAGNPYLRTPNMDRLAANGVRFEKAYTTQPLCVPYRSALQTGRWPHQTGVMMNNTTGLPADVPPPGPMLGSLVRNAGYQCGYAGKMHICHRRKNGERPIDLHPDDVDLHGYAPAQECHDEKIPHLFETFLRAHHNEPFFFTASFNEPHTCLGLGKDPNRYMDKLGPVPEDPDALPPLPRNHIPASDEPEILSLYWKTMEGDGKRQPGGDFGPAVSDSWSELQWRQYLWAYYRIIEKLDKDIGALLNVLEASGRADDTVVIFTVDHGDGAAHRSRRKKQTLYDESARVPFIVSGAGVINKGSVDKTRLVSAIDIPPSILDYAGAERPVHVDGQSLRPLVETGSWNDHPYVVTETLFNKGKLAPGWAGRMVRTPKYKYILYNHGKGREQLFNMEEDPLEMKNLAADPEHQVIRKQHREMLEQWGRQTGDTFLSEMAVKQVGE
jgi:arylsulfatase A-like enzyme